MTHPESTPGHHDRGSSTRIQHGDETMPTTQHEGNDLQVPCIHMNGTSAKSLKDDLCEAYKALRDAYTALKRTAPNGRDYYPEGPESLDRAIADHRHRLERIDEVCEELTAIAEAIDAQCRR